MDVWDIYERTASLIRVLDEASFRERADHLQDAVLSGCTSGEILDNLGVELRRLAKLRIRPDITDIASGLLREIDSILRG